MDFNAMKVDTRKMLVLPVRASAARAQTVVVPM
jgi:hypothetical protein